MNRDLFLAILSMDSYNRGYGQGITGLSNTGLIAITVTAITKNYGDRNYGDRCENP